MKCRPLSTAAIRAVETTGSTPGSVAKRLHRSTFRQISTSLRSIAIMRASNIWNSAKSALKYFVANSVSGGISDRVTDVFTKSESADGHDNTVLSHEAANMINQSRELCYEPVARSMQQLQVLLLEIFLAGTNRIVGRSAA